MTDKELLIKTAEHYGWDMQSTVCIEECAELIQALAKYRRVWGSTAPMSALFRSMERAAVIEEIADAQNMIEQIIYLMDAKTDVETVRHEKIMRQIHRIQGEAEDKNERNSGRA